MKFKPLHDRVLIEVLDSSEKTAGGIIIPDSAQEKPQEGKVVAVGGGAKTEDGKKIPMDVKVGDKVLFGKWSGTDVKIDGKDNEAVGGDGFSDKGDIPYFPCGIATTRSNKEEKYGVVNNKLITDLTGKVLKAKTLKELIQCMTLQ